MYHELLSHADSDLGRGPASRPVRNCLTGHGKGIIDGYIANDQAMRAEIGNNASSVVEADNRPEPPKDLAGWSSARGLAEKYNLSYDKLRTRLERWRHNNAEGWMEVSATERGSRDPKYLYELAAVQQVITKLQQKQRSPNVHREKISRAKILLFFGAVTDLLYIWGCS